MQRYGNGGKEEKPSIISAIGRPAHPLRGSRERFVLLGRVSHPSSIACARQEYVHFRECTYARICKS